VETYWEEWLLYRATGGRTEQGIFTSPISFVEAMYVLPDEMVKVFFELDKVYGKMERQYMKQKQKQNGGKGG
jgi:hypothetical protein